MTKKKVLEVQSVQLSILESLPEQLRIIASGTVPTGGWTDPELIQYVYVTPPRDGIYDFDFVAKPPEGIVTQVITPIEVSYTLESIPDDLKGARIHASTNAIVALLDRGFEELPRVESCRLISFDEIDIRPGFVTGTYFLIVSGNKPYINMEVNLRPLVYIRQPEYWGIEVVGCLPGIGLPATAPYTVSIPLEGIRGTKGIEVIGATRSERREISNTQSI